MPIDNALSHLKTDSYDVHDSLLPRVTVYGSGDDGDSKYFRFGNADGIEPLVVTRDFNGLAPESLEIAEEFRLLFNLYYIPRKNEYIDLENDTVVAKVEDDLVCIQKRYLKSYLALKDMAIILHIDSRYMIADSKEEWSSDTLSFCDECNNIIYTLTIDKAGVCPQNFSLLFGKKVIFGCSLKDCNVWPYNQEKSYLDFIIGVDENGKEEHYTCDPSKLQNLFGANPEAPYYLTPVFFDVAVLNKYYAKPEIYKVEDGIIRCGTLWSLYIDNQNAKAGYISAYLGDLGRDLPNEQEQHYWRGFNKVIDGQLSEAKFRRDFLAQFTNPESVDCIFKNTYRKVNQLFVQKFGWPLFLDFDEQDNYNFEGLRIPINNSIVEMDMLVLSLVKALLDSLNEREILKQLNGTYEKLTGSISRLETWFQEKQLADYQDHITFLRNLQKLRSTGTGHRKGENYYKASKYFDLKGGNYTEVFSNILKRATAFLEYIEVHITELEPN